MFLKMDKKAVYFSIDALIAVSIILLSVLVIFPLLNSPERQDFISGDVISSLSSLTVGEVNNDYVKGLIADGTIVDVNNSLLEQIGEFYVFDKVLARTFTSEVLSDVDAGTDFGLWIGEELVYSSNDTVFDQARDVRSSSQVISGIQEGEGVTAYSGRAFLSNNLQNDYFYFGGYVGEGNLSAIIEYYGTLNSVVMEAAVGGSFDLYVNGVYSGSYSGSGSFFTPSSYSFPIGSFSPGVNTLEFVGTNLNVAGGFIKTTYVREVSYGSSSKYRFPGIEGVINLYDGITFPENLSSMGLYLKFNSSQNVFLTVGNVTLYEGNTSGIEEVTLSNSSLSSLLDYSSIEGRTLPLRLGIHNLSYVSTGYREADVFSVTDLSGSMVADCVGESSTCCNTYFSCERVRTLCESCGGTYSTRNGGRCSGESSTCCAQYSCSDNSTSCGSCGGVFMDKVGEAIEANKAFIDIILNNSGNRAGLVGYRSTASDTDFHQLSSNNVSLKNEVDSWYASGSTCICCGINKAVQNLVSQSDESRFRSIIVMSDGEANVLCSQQGNGNAKLDAIEAACDAYNNYGILVYSIGFGSDVDEATLQSIASCGNGSYYYSSIADLADIYRQISEEVMEASFSEQTLVVEGGLYSYLSPESYINFTYNSGERPYGLISSIEKAFLVLGGGSFSVPEGSRVTEARVISYSGSRWTNNVSVNGIDVYDLSDYGSSYTELGDPYSVNLPLSFLSSSNLINLTTGLSPANFSDGSLSNKILYTLVSNLSAYSDLSAVSDGCNWYVEFEDASSLTFSTPEDYSGSEDCYYTPGGRNVSNDQDAVQVSVMNLLELLDYNDNGFVDVKFYEQDLQISSNEISGIPYDWSTKVQVRTWR
jgi:hypothetical protein